MYKYLINIIVSLALGLLVAHFAGLGPVFATRLGLSMTSREYFNHAATIRKKIDGAATKDAAGARTPKKPSKKEMLASMSKEEQRSFNMAEAGIKLDALKDPRLREGHLLKLRREYGGNLELFLKYNPLPPEDKKKILSALAASAFASNETILSKMAETGEVTDEERKAIASDNMNECHALLRQITDASLADKIAGLAENWSQAPVLGKVWENMDHFAVFMKDNAAPLENGQVNLLADFLIKENADIANDSVREAVSALLTPGQLEQFERYRYLDVLWNEYEVIRKETGKRFRNVILKWKKD
jgi:hypothetical protein